MSERVCIGPDEAIDLVDGRLDEAVASAIDRHVGECDGCRRVVAEVAARSSGTGSTRPGRAAPATALEAGTRVGRYILAEPIGRGGMGVVFRARDETLGRDVALKLVDLDGPDARARALREARALAQLSHPNVVAVHDAGEHGDATFIAMELVAGTSMYAWLDQATRTPAEILAVIADVARGLGAAHDLGLVHRDVKPGNILVGADGRSRIVDFGLARDAPGGERLALADALTHHTRMAGTPAYMSPEQLRGEPVDARTDQFALAQTAWEALYGARPYDADTAEERLAAIDEARIVEPPRERGGGHVEATLRRALSRDPAARFPDLRSFAAALTTPPSRAGRIALLATGAALLVAAPLAIWAAWPEPQHAVVIVPDAARQQLVVELDRREAAMAAAQRGGEALLAGDPSEAERQFDESLRLWPAHLAASQFAEMFKVYGDVRRARRFFEIARDMGDAEQRAAAEAELAELAAQE
jgi:hypothetical protein